MPAYGVEPAPLDGTELLTLEGDIASHMVAGIDAFLLGKIQEAKAQRGAHWRRDLASAEAYEQSIEPNRQRLAHILGLREARVPFAAPELVGTLAQPALVAQGDGYDVYAVRWPALGDVHGEGLLLVPTAGPPVANVVAIPDCGQSPEQLAGLTAGVPPESQFARRLAESGCRVIVPVLINRQDRIENLPNREWLYRAAFELGRGLIGYELQKALACVDWFSKQPGGPAAKIGVIGWGEGGLLALYAGALEPRIAATCVSGYFDHRDNVWQEPIDRNVFGLLEQFGDAELAAMVAPRTLVVEASGASELTFPPGGIRCAPGRIVTPKLEDVRGEVRRAAELTEGLKPAGGLKLVVSGGDGRGAFGSEPALAAFLAGLAPGAALAPVGPAPEPSALPDAAARHRRQFHELERHNQAVIAESRFVRKRDFWDKLNDDSLQQYQASIEPFRQRFAEELIGRFDLPPLPPQPRSRLIEENEKWTRYEVVLDVFPNVIAYGLLTLPKDVPPGERRPAVVCQHGLEGRPQFVIGASNFEYYHAFATELAERGFVTFAPQNPYLFGDRFRTLQRKANPLKKTLYSVIVPQHQQIVDWLQTLPQVDPERVAYYGLSYGGTTALRVPPLVPDYCATICSGNFNQWEEKTASIRLPYSYMHTGEYEIFEFDLAETFGHAEMAALIAPRPFMVERGHFDGVAWDEAVGAEYAKVRHLYAARLMIPDRTEIEWFGGPHAINAEGAYAFLHKHLDWPAPSR